MLELQPVTLTRPLASRFCSSGAIVKRRSFLAALLADSFARLRFIPLSAPY
jgi:hypothetical protein